MSWNLCKEIIAQNPELLEGLATEWGGFLDSEIVRQALIFQSETPPEGLSLPRVDLSYDEIEAELVLHLRNVAIKADMTLESPVQTRLTREEARRIIPRLVREKVYEGLYRTLGDTDPARLKMLIQHFEFDGQWPMTA